MMKPSYVCIIALLLLSACGDSKDETEKTSTPRVKKATRVESPSSNQVFIRGNTIPMTITSDAETAVDSVQVTLDDVSTTFESGSFEVSLPTQRVGTWRIRAKVFCGAESETHYRSIIVLPENAPQEMSYTVVNTYPHNPDDYTQGLLIHEGFLYESTGQKGYSTLKKKNLITGEELKVTNLTSEYFGEGLALFNDQFYQLTWTSGKAFLYDLELNQVGERSYQKEGWGLATYNDQLIMTDGSEKVYFIEPAGFTIMGELEVYDNKGKVVALNELEVIDGTLYANVYQEDYMVVVNLETGEVLEKIDFTGLLTSDETSDADVLNGIAMDPATGKIYVTGKWWPKLFEVTIEPKTL